MTNKLQVHKPGFHLFVFSARQHIACMLSVLYAIARPSVCLSITRVDHTITVEDRIVKFSPHYSSFRRLSFIQKF